MTGGLVDFHCHLDLYPDHAAVIAACDQDQVDTLTVTTTPKAWPRNRDLCAGTRHVRAALGLHPQLIAERADEIVLWETYLKEACYVGEVGLDAGPRFYRSLDQQKRAFEHILRCCAQAGGKVLSVHSVRAAGATLDLIESCLPVDRGRVVLHWFTGSRAEARRATDLGCYFSVNLETLTSERGQRLVSSLPSERLLTETDGPFTRIAGRPARPQDVSVTIELLSRTLKTDSGVVTGIVRKNFLGLVSFAEGTDQPTL